MGFSCKSSERVEIFKEIFGVSGVQYGKLAVDFFGEEHPIFVRFFLG